MIPWAKPDYWGLERQYVLEALDSSWISGGPFVDRLEADVAKLTGAAHALATSNGTTAIHLAYAGLGLGPGDEVIVPGFAFQAAANIAIHVGATPVFAEVDRRTWCLTAEAVAKKITPRTKAIVPVHTYGNMCDLDPILSLGIDVIEDAAESFASRYHGKHAGTIARLGTYSFHATKTITTGEGGMVLTSDGALRERMALVRSHGMSHTRYLHVAAGHNFRLTNLQAALGVAQLERLDSIVRERARVAARYAASLAKIPGVTPQQMTPGVEPVVWAIAIELDPRAFPQGRDAVMRQMLEAKIETRPGFYAASQQPIYRTEPLPICEAIASQVISLPTYPSLGDETIDEICARLAALRT